MLQCRGLTLLIITSSPSYHGASEEREWHVATQLPNRSSRCEPEATAAAAAADALAAAAASTTSATKSVPPNPSRVCACTHPAATASAAVRQRYGDTAESDCQLSVSMDGLQSCAELPPHARGLATLLFMPPTEGAGNVPTCCKGCPSPEWPGNGWECAASTATAAGTAAAPCPWRRSSPSHDSSEESSKEKQAEAGEGGQDPSGIVPANVPANDCSEERRAQPVSSRQSSSCPGAGNLRCRTAGTETRRLPDGRGHQSFPQRQGQPWQAGAGSKTTSRRSPTWRLWLSNPCRRSSLQGLRRPRNEMRPWRQ